MIIELIKIVCRGNIPVLYRFPTSIIFPLKVPLKFYNCLLCWHLHGQKSSSSYAAILKVNHLFWFRFSINYNWVGSRGKILLWAFIQREVYLNWYTLLNWDVSLTETFDPCQYCNNSILSMSKKNVQICPVLLHRLLLQYVLIRMCILVFLYCI